MATEIIVDEWGPEGDKMILAGDTFDGMAREGIGELLDLIKVAGVSQLVAETPRNSGALGDSTYGISLETPDGGEVQWHQPIIITLSSGAQVPLWLILRDGRADVYPVFKKALSSPDWPTPWMHSKAVGPNNYAERAFEAAQPEIFAAILAYAEKTGEKLVYAIKL